MAAPWNLITPENFINESISWKKEHHKNYLVMFSSVWNGFSTHPELWALPPDDHMVHRGDGVFESFKCVGGKVYCLDLHLERLKASAAALGIKLPQAFYQTLPILKEAYRLGNFQDFVIRICISRGPGSFNVNPYDTLGPEYYLITLKLKTPPEEIYQKGISIVTSPVPAKSEFRSIKSCDYLHNVLVKKYALDQGADYAVSFDRDGFLTEGPTENIAIVTKEGELLAPSWERILKGVTLTRVMDLANKLIEEGLLKSAANKDIPREGLLDRVSEVFLTTTSFDVLPVVSWDGKKIGQGVPGPVAKSLLFAIQAEINGSGPYLTPLG
ncbi:MAG: aminotransferase class IV [Deltaproteobacteria bacterium]|jgi:branched-chain amino acid aminotransferase|nr:aminotransferase class IV [Deltaproteobacteria bacterium]